MKQQRCKWEDGYIPTFEEIAENKRMLEKQKISIKDNVVVQQMTEDEAFEFFGIQRP